MDTKLEDMDAVFDAAGHPVSVTGMEEILQRAVLRMTIPKNAFVYNRDLRCSAGEILLSADKSLESMEMRLNEALADIGGIWVKILRAEQEVNRIRVTAAVQYKEKRIDKEVVLYIYGNI